jgi:nitrate reductase gamma subunit
MVVTGLAPAGVLFGFGVLLIAIGLFYGLLIPVQPMKAVLTDSLTSRSSGRLRRSSSTSLILGKMAKVCLLIALPCGPQRDRE